MNYRVVSSRGVKVLVPAASVSVQGQVEGGAEVVVPTSLTAEDLSEMFLHFTEDEELGVDGVCNSMRGDTFVFREKSLLFKVEVILREPHPHNSWHLSHLKCS